MNSVPTGLLSLILHAHLPFVRHPEHADLSEEDPLYEALTETYLPLIRVLTNLRQAGAEPRLTIGVSPSLCEMLTDSLLQTRYTRYLEDLLTLAEKELGRTGDEAQEFLPAARMYHQQLRAMHKLWSDVLKCDVVRAFGELQEAGVLEIMTCTATHGILPLISTQEARRAQIEIAVANYHKHFGRRPRGMWLPECAYQPGIETMLAEAHLEYFTLDTRAILYGEPRPRYGVYAPIRCPNGVAVFAHDIRINQQVGSSIVGYPSHPDYLDFYRDLGWEAPLEYIQPHLHRGGKRRRLGLKYHRITGHDVPPAAKLAYDPNAARKRARLDADHFISERRAQAARLHDSLGGRTPLFVLSYYAELFGQWWFEGVDFLNRIFSNLHSDHEEIRAITPGEYLDSDISVQIQQPSSSSLDADGFYKVWLNDSTAWMYPHQHAAERRLTLLANSYVEPPNDLVRRTLNQAARELLLAEGSDWAFQISHKTATAEYAARRFRMHINRFNMLADGIEQSRSLDETGLVEIEAQDNIFAELDYRAYQSK